MADCLSYLGITGTKSVHYNLSVAELVEQAILRGEGKMAANGALLIAGNNGKRFGRSPKDRLVSKLEGAVFVDAGNVWNMAADEKIDFIGSIAGDWGLGLRLNLNFILIRIDAGFKVHDPSLESGMRWVAPDRWLKKNGYALHFGVGYPF